MSPEEEKGVRNEEKFFAAARLHTKHTPLWFLWVYRASIKQDILGVDARVIISMKNGKRNIVPIQIKSSFAGAKKYQLEMPVLQAENVCTVVINQYMSDEDVRQRLYAVLEQIREENRRFDMFWEEILSHYVAGKTMFTHKKRRQRQRRMRESQEDKRVGHP